MATIKFKRSKITGDYYSDYFIIRPDKYPRTEGSTKMLTATKNWAVLCWYAENSGPGMNFYDTLKQAKFYCQKIANEEQIVKLPPERSMEEEEAKHK